MKMGLSLGLTVPRGSPAPPYDPAALSLTGWWRNYGGASPWSGTASAGSSGTNAASEATNPPAAGTALNGQGVAQFDGSNDKLTLGGTFGTYVDAGAGSGWILFRVTAIDTDDATAYNNDTLLSTQSSAYWSLYLKSTGTTIGIDHYDGSHDVVTTTFSLSTWTLVQWKWDGSAIKIRVNGGTWQPTTTGNLDALGLAESVAMGANGVTGGTFTPVAIAEMALADTVLSDATFDLVRGYINTRYGTNV